MSQLPLLPRQPLRPHRPERLACVAQHGQRPRRCGPGQPRARRPARSKESLSLSADRLRVGARRLELRTSALQSLRRAKRRSTRTTARAAGSSLMAPPTVAGPLPVQCARPRAPRSVRWRLTTAKPRSCSPRPAESRPHRSRFLWLRPSSRGRRACRRRPSWPSRSSCHARCSSGSWWGEPPRSSPCSWRSTSGSRCSSESRRHRHCICPAARRRAAPVIRASATSSRPWRGFLVLTAYVALLLSRDDHARPASVPLSGTLSGHEAGWALSAQAQRGENDPDRRARTAPSTIAVGERIACFT